MAIPAGDFTYRTGPPDLQCNGPRDCSGTERGCMRCGFAACGTPDCPCAGSISCASWPGDFTAQANRAATELLHEVDIELPVESYEILHALVAAAYGKGSIDAVGETAAIIRAELPE